MVAALEASEAQANTKQNEMRIAQRLKCAKEKELGKRFVDGKKDGECLGRCVLYADDKLAGVDLEDENKSVQEHNAENKLIQEQRREIVERVKLAEVAS